MLFVMITHGDMFTYLYTNENILSSWNMIPTLMAFLLLLNANAHHHGVPPLTKPAHSPKPMHAIFAYPFSKVIKCS